VVDGGLQAAVLLSERVLGGASLPMGIQRFRAPARGLAAGPLRCLVHARQMLSASGTCDIAIVDAAGNLVVAFQGVEGVLRPDHAEHAAVAV
jgi:hypothetical protein